MASFSIHVARGSRQAFSLIELLVVIAIISILVGLLLPAVMFAQAAARRAACDSNLSQLRLALELYLDTTRGVLPIPPDENRVTGWAIAILPYMEEASLYDRFNQNWPASAPVNAEPRKLRPPLFACPDTSEWESPLPDVPVTNYVLVIDPPKQNQPRHRRAFPYYLKEAAAEARFPWCLSPEIERANSHWEPPHPSAFNLF